VPLYCSQPATVIFELTRRYNEDTHPRKLNLGVGAYRSEELKPVVFTAVKKAERAVVDNAAYNKEYLPVLGDVSFRVRETVDSRARFVWVLTCCDRRSGASIVDACAPCDLLVQAAAQKLMFGADHPTATAGRIRTVQTLSGTGGLTLAAHLLK